MANQTIPDSGAQIENIVPESWQKGKCPPSWNETSITFNDTTLTFFNTTLTFGG